MAVQDLAIGALAIKRSMALGLRREVTLSSDRPN
jgi:hypothetical protein